MIVRTGIVADSNCGIRAEEAEKLGVHILPMPFFVNEMLFFEGVTLSEDDFYNYLDKGADISTSQPSPGDVMEFWDKLLKEYDELLVIPMSSSLSSTCETAMMLSKEYNGKVVVTDNKTISVTQRQAIFNALKLRDEGKNASDIKEALEFNRKMTNIYIMVDTLKYLKKGGRVTPAAATIGAVLNIKPVLCLETEKLDSFAKARGGKQARKIMLDAMEKDLQEKFKGETMNIFIAHTCESSVVKKWVEEVEKRFPDHRIKCDSLSLSIACHVGPGSLAIACAKPL